jgi:beta-lactamase regulating signal transducer with metallopeptidase domain
MLWWFAETALVTTLLAGFVSLACRLGRFRPAVRHALWLIVLIRLVTPPLLQWPWALPSFAETLPSGQVQAEDLGSPKAEFLPSRVEMVLTMTEPAPGESLPLSIGDLPEDDEPRGPNPAERTSRPLMAWLAPVLYNTWLAGTAILCLVQFVRIVRFRRLLARTDLAPRWLEKLVSDVAGTLQVRLPCTLIVPRISSPFVWSLGRPKSLWPASLLERLPQDAQRSIVVHELAHLRRRDHWVGWLQLVAECVWWWNPFFWYVRRQLRLNAELACDAWVVATLPQERRAYAEALIEVTQLIAQTAAPMPALGMSGAARQDFERRLTMIMRDRVPCRVPFAGLLAMGALALLSLPGWSQVQVREAENGKEAPPPEKRIIIVGSQVDGGDVLRILPGEVRADKADGKTMVWSVKDVAVPTEDREQRLQKLEQQLQELMKEVQALRGGDSRPQRIYGYKVVPSDKTGKIAESTKRPLRIIERNSSDKTSDSKSKTPEDTKPAEGPDKALRWEVVPGTQLRRSTKATGREILLVRVIYQLPHAKAEALASLLSQHRKVEVLEAKVEGDNLTVTTTPEAEQAITQFISLISGSTKAGEKGTKTGKVSEFKPAEIHPAEILLFDSAEKN